MPTYRDYQRQRELKAQRARQDARDAALHREFDLSAKDNHMKYERAQFAVVTASDAFRVGYDQIRWRDAAPETAALPQRAPSSLVTSPDTTTEAA